MSKVAASPDTQAAVRSLRQRLADAEENAQRAISRELHDSLGQRLVAIKLAASAARTENDRTKLTLLLEEVSRIADEAIQETRDIASSLRAFPLEEQGLGSALRAHAQGLLRTNPGIAIETEIAPLPREPDHRIGLACFRIAQEAISNALRHANASRIRIGLEYDQAHDALLLAIEDDGRGIQPEAIHRDANGQGLLSMRERAQLVGANLSVRAIRNASDAAIGTCVRAAFPVAGASI